MFLQILHKLTLKFWRNCSYWHSAGQILGYVSQSRVLKVPACMWISALSARKYNWTFCKKLNGLLRRTCIYFYDKVVTILYCFKLELMGSSTEISLLEKICTSCTKLAFIVLITRTNPTQNDIMFSPQVSRMWKSCSFLMVKQTLRRFSQQLSVFSLFAKINLRNTFSPPNEYLYISNSSFVSSG